MFVRSLITVSHVDAVKHSITLFCHDLLHKTLDSKIIYAWRQRRHGAIIVAVKTEQIPRPQRFLTGPSRQVYLTQ